MLKRFGCMVVAAASLAACSDSMVPTEAAVSTGGTQAPSTADQSILTALTCRVDVAANSMNCGPTSPAPVPGRSEHLILGGQNVYVKLANTVPVNNGTTITTSVTVQNLTGQPWGTGDGTTPTTEGPGVLVFFYTPPTNGVTVNAPYNYTFTDVNQQYFQYAGADLGPDGILSPGEAGSPGETSLGQTWVFTLNGASSFSFQLMISTMIPNEEGVLHWSRNTAVSTPAYFNTVWGSASNDVWAAGKTGSLSHWNGTAWSNFASAPGAGDVNAIWGTGASDVYAASNGTGIIQHFDGTSWSSEVTAGYPISGLWGTTSTDVWAVGQAGKVAHRDAGGWSVWPTNLSGTPDLSAVWGTGPTNVYAVGGAVVWQYTGSSGQDWQAIDVSAANPSSRQLRTIWGSSPTDIWVAGTNGFLMRLVGGTWTQQADLGSNTIVSLWGSAEDDVYATSDAGEIWHYNGIAWVALSNSNSVLNGVWGSGNQDVWVVGTVSGNTSNLALHGIR